MSVNLLIQLRIRLWMLAKRAHADQFVITAEPEEVRN